MINTLFAQTKPQCIGRYVIDVSMPFNNQLHDMIYIMKKCHSVINNNEVVFGVYTKNKYKAFDGTLFNRAAEIDRILKIANQRTINKMHFQRMECQPVHSYLLERKIWKIVPILFMNLTCMSTRPMPRQLNHGDKQF
ncbi:hypothetical protein [Citrobacter telavivensis]